MRCATFATVKFSSPDSSTISSAASAAFLREMSDLLGRGNVSSGQKNPVLQPRDFCTRDHRVGSGTCSRSPPNVFWVRSPILSRCVRPRCVTPEAGHADAGGVCGCHPRAGVGIAQIAIDQPRIAGPVRPRRAIGQHGTETATVPAAQWAEFPRNRGPASGPRAAAAWRHALSERESVAAWPGLRRDHAGLGHSLGGRSA